VSPGRPAAVDLARVRFSVDEQLAGLGLGLMALRSDIVVASHPPIADFPRDDPDWIPQVAAHGWVVITNDKHIRTRPGEAEVALQTGLRCVHLAPQREPLSAGTSPACCCVTGTPSMRYAPTRVQFGSSWIAAPHHGSGRINRVSHLACHPPTGRSDRAEPSRRGRRSPSRSPP
jgi:PIN like domain